MAPHMQRFSLRFVLEVVFVIAAGLAGYQAVYSGEAHRWPGFQVREGYWGTQFMSPLLYAMGDETVALRIVSGIWFGYAVLIAAGLVTLGRLCFYQNRPTNHSREAESTSA